MHGTICTISTTYQLELHSVWKREDAQKLADKILAMGARAAEFEVVNHVVRYTIEEISSGSRAEFARRVQQLYNTHTADLMIERKTNDKT